MNNLLDWVLNRLTERSTIVALMGLLAAAGVSITTNQSDSVVAAVLALAAVLNAFFKENGSPDAP